ncbi:RluA family pseudouridine synthase [Fluviicola taffensis]|uniref:Pseudouridine synthase n=1 Tax=Fluviicola taffensis (strain DSM 16823 / NCIMB 13979 / RW262) TaxID=755732 RepID=F2IAC0_FLUTR|nr:RluA family pseudouridine synthase [Fluviicola taffensis]AEA42055.1 pseudouridine synthase [Fluviicola taffensis DSM 16823]
MSPKNPKFISFKSDVSKLSRPEKFTFPFYYEPHELAFHAMDQLQDYLLTQKDWIHNFGLDDQLDGLIIGKMFGVLVVEDKQGDLGFLAAFSGKLAESNDHDYFVPPVFDLLDSQGFFRKEEVVINDMTITISELEENEAYSKAKIELQKTITDYGLELQNYKKQIKESKAERKQIRETSAHLEGAALEELLEDLRKKSIQEQYFLKDFTHSNKQKIAVLEEVVTAFETELNELKEKRKSMSNTLQKEIFDSYYFVNSKKEKRSLQSIFQNTIDHKPPAGAGECAAPKLLQFAFENELKPICLGEFWWGASPKSEIRLHKQVYPACRGKCEPILGHMLGETEMDENPMLLNPAENKDLEIVFEDDYIVIVNKPAEFLSVPGKSISDSVYTRMKEKYPHATGPLIVHRLDMSTSGLLVIAKDKIVHKHLQKQFIKRNVQKRYVALLEGIISERLGTIDLPLRVDLDDRPRQLVCYEHGKRAVTKWEVIEHRNNQTLIYFYPITGRTHQLRVHAAHTLGLNAPILGDDLYGNRATRLHLHAQFLQFTHPITKEAIKIKVDAEFS